jgi:histidyl-tRNA synthetase
VLRWVEDAGKDDSRGALRGLKAPVFLLQSLALRAFPLFANVRPYLAMSSDQIRSLPGTEDLMPDQGGHWRALRDAAVRLFELYGYGELRTPIIEDTRLFIKGTGETTDIVQKQMYTLETGEGESITLRPEGTPSAVRAYLQQGLHKQEPFQKFWYAGPMFRRERPQKGRLRQFHQIGVEVIGSASPLADAETLLLAAGIYRAVGLKNHQVFLNSIGCEKCRPACRDELRRRLEPHRSELCEDCRSRLDRNVLRVMDCKNEACAALVAELPGVSGYLCEECTAHYEGLKAVLERRGLPFQEDPRLVRGLDYYTRTVYEIKHAGLGARDTICAGGRYDDLVEQLGGPATPCVGFAMGVEASVLAMEAESGPAAASGVRPTVFVVCFDEEGRGRCFDLVCVLRAAGVSAEMDFEKRSAKAQMRRANRLGCPYCFLIGERELAEGKVLIKEMAGGQQWNVAWQDAPAEMARIAAGK